MADDYYHDLGMSDARKKRYPLWAVLLMAGCLVEAKAYETGWKTVTGKTLLHWRDGVKF